MTYDQWRTSDYDIQTDRDDADHRLIEINAEIASYEEDCDVDHEDEIFDLNTEAMVLKQFLGITEF